MSKANENAAHFRSQAVECRLQAEKAVSQLDKESWLKLAAGWIKLAEELEKRRF